MAVRSTGPKALIGKQFRVSLERGRFVDSPLARWVTATIHPSAILRIRTEEERREARTRFVEDIRKVASVLANGGG